MVHWLWAGVPVLLAVDTHPVPASEQARMLHLPGAAERARRSTQRIIDREGNATLHADNCNPLARNSLEAG